MPFCPLKKIWCGITSCGEQNYQKYESNLWRIKRRRFNSKETKSALCADRRKSHSWKSIRELMGVIAWRTAGESLQAVSESEVDKKWLAIPARLTSENICVHFGKVMTMPIKMRNVRFILELFTHFQAVQQSFWRRGWKCEEILFQQYCLWSLL